jgi:fructosamine-3-kinase
MNADLLDLLGAVGPLGGSAAAPTTVEPLPGGCVADVWLVTRADGSRLVAKTVTGADDDVLQVEAEGLGVLRETGGLRTPHVFRVTRRILILEALPALAATEENWAAFARSLAAMHAGTGHDLSGWPRDGYLGRLRQVNTWTRNGHEFFAQHRLLRYLNEPTVDQALDIEGRRALERLCARLPEIVPAMPAVLIHGDLWSGNLLSTDSGAIAVIDPAVCYAWAEIDLSMLWCNPRPARSRRFFDVYQELNPSPPGWVDRMPILNLRELLSTVAHFGAEATAASTAIRQILAPFRRS